MTLTLSRTLKTPETIAREPLNQLKSTAELKYELQTGLQNPRAKTFSDADVVYARLKQKLDLFK